MPYIFNQLKKTAPVLHKITVNAADVFWLLMRAVDIHINVIQRLKMWLKCLKLG